MKKLLLITVLLVLITTKSSAQGKKNMELTKIDNNQFKIKAHEELDINLKFNLEQINDCSVLIYNSRKYVVFSRKHCKEGENKIEFRMDEGEQYLVKLTCKESIKLVTTAFAEN